MNDSDEQIMLNYNIQMRIKDFQRRLEVYDMVDVFDILRFDDAVYSVPLTSSSYPVSPLGPTINLLEKWDSISEKMLAYHVKFLRLYGRDWDLQNLDWSLELLEASCDLKLADKVKEDLIAIGPSLESGPYYFFLAMKQIVSSSEDSVLGMITKVRTLKLSQFDGEDVPVATGQIKMALVRLRVLKKVPAEINRHVLDVLQTSSVKKFNLFFAQLQVNLKQIPSFELTTDDILTMADRQYQELKVLGDWTSVNNKASSYLVEGNDGNQDPTICKRCGKSHPGRKCEIPHWRTVPPAEGKSETMQFNGRTYFWCGICKRWNTTHKTSEHTGKKSSNPSLSPAPSPSPAPAPSPSPANPSSDTSLTPSLRTTSTDISTLSSGSNGTAPQANLVTYDLSALHRHRSAIFKTRFSKITE